MQQDNNKPEATPPAGEPAASQAPGAAVGEPEFVVVDRRALNQMLDAVVSVLDATRDLEQLAESSDFTPEQLAQASIDVGKVREALANGIRHMKDSVAKLPTVKIKEGE